MIRIHYLAYGSNLHPLRISERIPSARFIRIVPMPGRSVRFHKRSTDLSGKCNLVESESGNVAFGALYELAASDKELLDRIEGLGYGYQEATVKFTLDDVTYFPFVYVASKSHVDSSLKPYHWYKQLVLAGARHHRFPAEYIKELESTASIPDQNAERDAQHQLLIDRLKEYSMGYSAL